MYLLMNTWICVTLAARLCHSLDEHPPLYKQVLEEPTCLEDQFLCFNHDCIPKSRVCDGTCHCNSCEDEPTSCWQNESNLLDDIMGQFWTIFFIAVVLSIWCLVDKTTDVSSSEDVEQSQQPQNNATSASQQLPSYYLHTLHRPQSPLPVTEIQRGIPGGSSNALATNSSNESDQVLQLYLLMLLENIPTPFNESEKVTFS